MANRRCDVIVFLCAERNLGCYKLRRTDQGRQGNRGDMCGILTRRKKKKRRNERNSSKGKGNRK